jgi:ArsR family transcriptional regulator
METVPTALSLRQAARAFKMLGDEARLRLLLLMAERGPLCVSALGEAVGLSAPAVSHHLKLLRLAGLIGCRREGQFNIYHLTDGWPRDLLQGLKP